MVPMGKLMDIIAKSFGPPFLEEGHVKVWNTIDPLNGKRFWHLKIGRRDIELDDGGNMTSSGTDVA